MLMEDLTGTWRLQSLRWLSPAGEILEHPLGMEPHGVLIYTASGHVSVHMAAAGRPPLSSDWRGASEGERARAHATYLGYAGRFEIRGDTVIHEVDVSANPSEVGLAKLRFARRIEDELVLRSPQTETSIGPVVIEACWTRG